MRIFSILFLTILSFYVNAQNLKSGGKLKPEQAIMDIRHYTIALDIDIVKRWIEGSTEIECILSKPTDTLLFDLVHLLEVHKVAINNSAVKFVQLDDKIYIITGKPLAAGRQSVKIEYGGEPPVAVRPPWLGGFTWTQDKSGNPWVAINCQKEGGVV